MKVKFKAGDHLWAFGYMWAGQDGYIMARFCGDGLHENWFDIKVLYPRPLQHIPAINEELVGFISRPIQR